MAEAVTPNLGLIKPDVGGSNSTWGNRLNVDLDKLDTAIGTNTTKAANSLKKDDADPLERTARQLLLYDSAVTIAPTDAKALVSREMLAAIFNTMFPIGAVILWYGQAANVPAGWLICNGQQYGTTGIYTPNLLNRFAVMAGGTFALGATGGVSSLSFNIRSEAIALQQYQMPVHNHAVVDPTHTHTASQPAHTHTVTQQIGGSTGVGGANMPGATNSTTGSAQPAVTVNAAYTGIGIANAGSGGVHDHGVSAAIPYTQFWPQFYALYYIMRVALV
jgi:hypothetical protein